MQRTHRIPVRVTAVQVLCRCAVHLEGDRDLPKLTRQPADDLRAKEEPGVEQTISEQFGKADLRRVGVAAIEQFKRKPYGAHGNPNLRLLIRPFPRREIVRENEGDLWLEASLMAGDRKAPTWAIGND